MGPIVLKGLECDLSGVKEIDRGSLRNQVESGPKWSQRRAREDEEGSFPYRGVGVRVPLARFSNAPRKSYMEQ